MRSRRATAQLLAVLAAAAAGASAGCRRRAAPPARPAAARADAGGASVNEDEDPQPRLRAPAPRAPAARCALDAPRWLVPVSQPDAGPVNPAGLAGELGPEGATTARTAAGDVTAWLDRAAEQFVVALPGGELLRQPVGGGEPTPPVLVVAGEQVVLASAIQRTRTARVHRVMTARAGALADVFTAPETTDGSMSLAAAPTARGVLLAWDEDRASGTPGESTGAIVGQLVAPGSLAAPPAGRAPAAPPATRVLSPPEHDAGDPVLVPMPNGTTALLWLAAQGLDASVASQTASDIFVRLLAADGAPGGAPVQITPGPANRFGVAALAHQGALWVAYRVAGDSDQESRGDGGRVAIVRLGPDLHPTASPAYLSAPDAMPSGQPVVLADARGGVTVFWTERRSDALQTLRRPVEPDGTLTRPAQDEPALGGALPAHGDAASARVVVRGPAGEPGLATVRCPPVAVEVPAAPPRAN